MIILILNKLYIKLEKIKLIFNNNKGTSIMNFIIIAKGIKELFNP